MLQTFDTELTKKEYLTHDVMLLRFSLPAPARAQSGQYMIIFVPNDEGDPYRRLYSIASDCTDLRTFDIVAKIITGGKASEYFKKLQIGDHVAMQGPAGVFQLHQDDKNHMFLATGTGIAPIKAMLHDLLTHSDAHTAHPDRKLYLLWGLRTYKDVYYFDELRSLADKHKNFIFKICLSREETFVNVPEDVRHYFFLGRITELHDKQNDDIQEINIPAADAAQLIDFDFYLCGDRAVVESLRQYLYDRGFSRQSVIFEKF